MNQELTVEICVKQYITVSNTMEMQQTALQQLLSYYNKNEVSMLNLIQLLNIELISLDDKLRNRATMLLAEILTQTKCPITNSQQLNILINFFISRLADVPSLLPSLHALIALVQVHFPTVTAADNNNNNNNTNIINNNTINNIITYPL